MGFGRWVSFHLNGGCEGPNRNLRRWAKHIGLLASLRNFGASRIRHLRGCVDHDRISGKEVGAGCPSQSRTHSVRGRLAIRGAFVVQGHHINLIARDAGFGLSGLIHERMPTKRPIRLGIVTSKRQLTNVREVNFLRISSAVVLLLIGRGAVAFASHHGQQEHKWADFLRTEQIIPRS